MKAREAVRHIDHASEEDSLKVTVLGGSVAGLHVAQNLLSSNYDVEVELYERKMDFGENIICAGGISSHMVKRLNLVIPSDFIAMKVNKVKFYSPSFEVAELTLHKEYGLILWRDRWEKWLGEKVRELGCKVHFKSSLTARAVKNSDLIIGADGLTGISRKLINRGMPDNRDVHLAIQTVAESKILDEEAISMFLGSQIAPKGYGWAFPIGGNTFRIGLGVPLTHIKHLVPCFKNLLTSVEAKTIERPKSKLIPTAKPEKNLIDYFLNKPLALVGDSALQTDPATGGGIANAIIGAKCLTEAVNIGNVKAYNKLWKAELYRRNMQRYRLKEALYEMSDGEFEMLVNELKDFKPMSESLGFALIHLIIHLALRHPRFITRHKILRRLLA